MIENNASKIENIQKAVANYFDVTVAQLISSQRFQSIAYPRQIAMYLSRQLTNESFLKIGRQFGGKHHTTVMSNVKKIAKLVENNHSRTPGNPWIRALSNRDKALACRIF